MAPGRPALFWSGIVLLGLALVPHFGSSGYLAAAGLLGEEDHTLEPRLKSLLEQQEHPEARREIEQIRRQQREARILSLLELHGGLACLAQLLGVIFAVVARRSQPGLWVAALCLLAYAPTSALVAANLVTHLPAWSRSLAWSAVAANGLGLALLVLGRPRGS